MRYLLIGNPNVGKSSVFNRITDTYAHVGNYGGITVEQKQGKFEYGEIIDLPGTYSVSPNSTDEGVVTHSLIEQNYDCIINIVDSTHLKRNLHLTIQLLELGYPVYLVANMVDELRYSGKQIDFNKLASKLKCQVYGVSAKTKEGLDILKESLKTPYKNQPFQIYYGTIIEKAIDKIIKLINSKENSQYMRWLAIQLLEGNDGIKSAINVLNMDELTLIIEQTEKEIINSKTALSLKGAIFNCRRTFIDKVIKESVVVITSQNKQKELNNKIDRIITHPFYGFLLFILVMFSIYFLTFDFFGTIISDYMDLFISDYFSPFVQTFLNSISVKDDSLLMTLIIDGVIAGVGGVIIFVPQISILFLILAFVEGTGYMARVAIMLDTLLSKFGLNGKSIVPLVTGLGCNVPAIMATRTIADKKERLLTILIIPFMSCSARIPIYALLASLFFDKYKAVVIISMYVIGTIVALISAKLLSLSIFKNNNNNFILEIPPYRLPSGKNVYRYTKLMIMDFINKAGKFILLGSILLWFLQYIGPGGKAITQDTSFLAYLGNFFAPIFAPIGFGSWEATSSLIVGFLAKELIVSSMIVIYGEVTTVSYAFTGLSAYTFMVFSLLYLPCLATVGTIKQETKSNLFTLFSLLFTFVVAYIVSLLVYQIGLLLI